MDNLTDRWKGNPFLHDMAWHGRCHPPGEKYTIRTKQTCPSFHPLVEVDQGVIQVKDKKRIQHPTEEGSIRRTPTCHTWWALVHPSVVKNKKYNTKTTHRKMEKDDEMHPSLHPRCMRF